MFERIMIPLDGSEAAEIALPYGEELARRLGSEVILLHVPGSEHQQYERMHKMYLDRLAETVKHNIKRGQQKGTQVKVTTKVEAGEPHENICNLVDKDDIDLIIMVSVSASGLKIAKMLGSVTDHVCRTVPIPVMLIRPQDVQRIESKKRLINRILLPLDGSDLSRLALPVGEEMSAMLKVPITLFQMARIIIPYADAMVGTPFINYPKWIKDEEKVVRVEINALEKKLREKGLTITHIITSGFNAADEIIQAGKKVDADLIVMSTHGRSGLGLWALGSVAERVLRYSEIPLLLVNARVD
jgi:nucleotide-binding universal stress UspA family protein